MKKKVKINKFLKLFTLFTIGILLLLKFYPFDRNETKTDEANIVDNSQICPRSEPYPMDPEFSRAYSLLIQRFADNSTNNIAKMYLDTYTRVYNCVNIKYANSDAEINDAEGVFYFSPESTKERLNILVSPRYKNYDDLMTALLLSHELMHAWNYSNKTYSEESTVESCYSDEISAFTAEYIFFFSMLNEEEKKSIFARGVSGLSPVTEDFLKSLLASYNDRTKAFELLEFVKNHPYYQTQCGSRT